MIVKMEFGERICTSRYAIIALVSKYGARLKKAVDRGRLDSFKG